ncbi:hypothetical protein LINPERPRIM_LOCUS33142 [Linum perenne]
MPNPWKIQIRHRLKHGNLFRPSKGSFVRELGEFELHRSFTKMRASSPANWRR